MRWARAVLVLVAAAGGIAAGRGRSLVGLGRWQAGVDGRVRGRAALALFALAVMAAVALPVLPVAADDNQRQLNGMPPDQPVVEGDATPDRGAGSSSSTSSSGNGASGGRRPSKRGAARPKQQDPSGSGRGGRGNGGGGAGGVLNLRAPAGPPVGAPGVGGHRASKGPQGRPARSTGRSGQGRASDLAGGARKSSNRPSPLSSLSAGSTPSSRPSEAGTRARQAPRAERNPRLLIKPPVGGTLSSGGWQLLPTPLLVGIILVLGTSALLVARGGSKRPAQAGLPGASQRAMAPRTGSTRWALSPRSLGLIAEAVVIGGVVVAVGFALQALVVKPFRIPSESMVPTLGIGQQVLVDRLTPRFDAPDRGDIVVFAPPAGAGANRCGVRHPIKQACPVPIRHTSDTLFIKRVVGVAGDRLKILRGRVYIDGKPQPEPAVRPDASCPVCNQPIEITIPRGHLFVMGDNRGASADSRYWGPIPQDSIIGRAFLSYWPPRQAGGL